MGGWSKSGKQSSKFLYMYTFLLDCLPASVAPVCLFEPFGVVSRRCPNSRRRGNLLHSSLPRYSLHDWGDSENQDRGHLGELRIRSKTKAGPLEDKQLSRLGNIALVR